MRRLLLPASATIAAGALLLTTGCTSSPRGGPGTRPQPERASSVTSSQLTSQWAPPAGLDLPGAGYADELDAEADDQIAEALSDLFFSQDIRGTAPQIALRFMRALQRKDDLAAAREVLGVWRMEDAWVLHRVMNDVRRHAALEGAGACTRALPFKHDLVLVACGGQRVMVQASDDVVPGVTLFDRPRHFGEYRHPHTWAITTVDL